jgi:hypothetical protein
VYWQTQAPTASGHADARSQDHQSAEMLCLPTEGLGSTESNLGLVEHRIRRCESRHRELAKALRGMRCGTGSARAGGWEERGGLFFGGVASQGLGNSFDCFRSSRWRGLFLEAAGGSLAALVLKG